MPNCRAAATESRADGYGRMDVFGVAARMLEQVATGLIGFSVCSAALLLIAAFTVYATVEQDGLSRLAGVVLLMGLALLQLAHAGHLARGDDVIASRGYVTLLYVVAPAFYLFFRGVLQPRASERWSSLLYFAPAVVAPWLAPALAVPLAFLFGFAYALRLAGLVHRLRGQRARFRMELAVFGAFAAISLAILLLGLASPLAGLHAFVLGYAISIGLAFLLAVYVLLRFPDIAGKTAEAVAVAYAVSTLSRVDRDDAVARLQQAMDDDKVYLDENLSLASLATQVGLSPHQLSELVNTQFGVGFSRYVRGHRVEAARRMLLAEPDASVLSVGLAVGFTSQSNFYAAFREITGEVPGRYRRRQTDAQTG
ncbi:MAG: AraC family transcriptional regulator [Dokdonella sp.]